MSGFPMGGLSSLLCTAMLLASPVVTSVVPKEALRFRAVREQEQDRTCGYAVLATLLSDYCDIAVREDELVDQYPSSDPLNFLEMKAILDSYGVAAGGYRLETPQLSEVLAAYGPIIVHLHEPYPHFGLLLTASSGWYLLGDPAVGATFLDERSFSRRWSGAVLVVGNDGESTETPVLLDEAARLESLLWHAYR